MSKLTYFAWFKLLTDTKIKKAEIREKAYKISDSGGLFLHVHPNGGKYWRLKYRIGQKEKLLSFGVYGSQGKGVTLKDARKKRDEAKDQISKGIDPSTFKKQFQSKAQESRENTFENIANEWHVKKLNNLAESTCKRHRQLLNNDILPYLGKRPIAELETYELVSCLNRIVDRGALSTAHKARQAINQICKYAKQTGRIKINPASDMEGSIPPMKKSHMAAITEPKLFGKMLVRIDAYKGTHIIRTALALAPLLFQRPGELCAMEWSELDFEKRLWIIPQGKKKERNQVEGDHIVPLSKQSLSLISDIKPLTGHGKYVFPNQRKPSRPMRTESLGKALRNIGIDTAKQHSSHGFRASARTMLEEQLQIRIEWIEQQLAHRVQDPLGRTYNRTKHLPERIVMMQRWADYLDDLKREFLSKG